MRLYDRRAELLIPAHPDLIQGVLRLLPSLPSESQGPILRELSVFADRLPRRVRRLRFDPRAGAGTFTLSGEFGAFVGAFLDALARVRGHISDARRRAQRWAG